MIFRTHYLTKNDCYAAAAPLTPTGIVVHSTGVDQKRIAAYRWQFDRPGQRSAVHGIIGLDEDGALCCEQWLPYSIQCWGCGSGPKGSFNHSHIQFEIAETLDDGAWCRETCAAALELCARLCREYGIDPENVVCHSEAHALGYGSNHGDVMHWWPKHGLSMEQFRKELKERMDYAEFERFMERWEQERAAQPEPDWSKAEGAWERAKKAGVLDGSRPEAPVKRDELAAVLGRMGLLNAPEGETKKEENA
ncbi:MAG: N-acetylmuramoyl-L-alanine amidase [Oscillospiraceae bacterium]